MHDKNGTEIKAGDTLFNQHDRDKYHTVLQDGDGRLFLGDFDSPLERYAPQTWWEVVHNAQSDAKVNAFVGIVRNPHGHSEDEIRAARLALCDAFEDSEKLLAYKNDTANTFMAQVKKLQARCAELKEESEYYRLNRDISGHAYVDMLQQRDELVTKNLALQAKLTALRAENAELRKDAERYRWLRSKDTGPGKIWELIGDDCQPNYMTLKHSEELDAAIDAEREKP